MERFRQYLLDLPELGIRLDVSHMAFGEQWLKEITADISAALSSMGSLERGAMANPDESRMVGHYWLRTPELAPEAAITQVIIETLDSIKQFAHRIHSGAVKPPSAPLFTDVLVIGIGGSALGPQLVADALGSGQDLMAIHFLDNTDPDGFDRMLGRLGVRLSQTLVLVVSKSGGTAETRNGMLEVAHAYERQGLSFAAHAVAITQDGSKLFQQAKGQGWLHIFPMWDWVGGRTSVMSAVGLLPMALQGLDIDGFLAGAQAMDSHGRVWQLQKNPAAMMAAMWLHATRGRAEKAMVVLPYKDRLVLFSRYLQQLVMESLGKALDLEGKPVHQGIVVYGNKGSTDQHAYVQQLREGPNNFFATFIEVFEDRPSQSMEVEPGITSGDYLLGFLLGTRQALRESGRESLTLSMQKLDARSLGALIALYERAVGIFAYLVNINAYHQPGVEAGKKAAGAVLALQQKLQAALKSGERGTALALASVVGEEEQAEAALWILEHLALNGRIQYEPASPPWDTVYWSR